MKTQLVLQVGLIAACLGLLPVLGDDTDNPVRFIQEFQLIKDHTQSELSEIYEKAEKEYDPHKSRSEQKGLFDDLDARSTRVQKVAVKKAFEVVKPHSAKNAAAELACL